MKKRMLCLFLAAILLTAALTQSLPRAEAANSGYQVLADFIQQNGSPAFSNSYGYATENRCGRRTRQKPSSTIFRWSTTRRSIKLKCIIPISADMPRGSTSL